MPKGWKEVKVEEICEKPQYGFTASAVADKIGPRFVRITDITTSGVKWDSVPYCICAKEKLPKYQLNHNDILFARIGATTGKSFIVKKPPHSVFASYLIRLRAKEGTLPDFLYYYFQSENYWDQINANKDNNLKGGVNGSVLSNLDIVCPSITEQHKIAAILFKIHKAIEIQEKIIESTKELKKATMQHLFTKGLHGEKTKQTEIGEIPENWEICKINDLGDIVTGTTPPTANREYYDRGGYQFIAPVDIGNTTKIYSAEKEISEKGLSVSRVLPPNTTCFVSIGSTIGKVGITVSEKSATNQQINAIIPNKNLDPFFIAYLLVYNSKYITGLSSPNPVPILSKGKFSGIDIAITKDKKEQGIIAQYLLLIDTKLEISQSKKFKLQALFKSTLNKLMTAQIRVNDLKIDVSEMQDSGIQGFEEPRDKK